ncbi:MAG: hypothetical protein JXR37_25030, partial [Kiritimatiellae bacterium]|nr:hypothetical protein [Kiritimatiellia bacterium]
PGLSHDGRQLPALIVDQGKRVVVFKAIKDWPGDLLKLAEERPADGPAAECYTHPGRRAVDLCRQCGRFLCDECLTYHADTPVCKACVGHCETDMVRHGRNGPRVRRQDGYFLVLQKDHLSIVRRRAPHLSVQRFYFRDVEVLIAGRDEARFARDLARLILAAAVPVTAAVMLPAGPVLAAIAAVAAPPLLLSALALRNGVAYACWLGAGETHGKLPPRQTLADIVELVRTILDAQKTEQPGG